MAKSVMTTGEIYNRLPAHIKNTLLISEGWLVGGSVIDESPKDYDIIVEDPELFMRTVQYLTGAGFLMGANSYGGLKFTGGPMHAGAPSIDLWVESLSHFIISRRKNKDIPLFNLKYLTLLQAL